MAVLTVGQNGLNTINDAVVAAQSGDTVDVPAGTYTNDFFYVNKSLTVQAIGGEVHLVSTGQGLAGKAAIITGTATGHENIAINGFDVSGVAVDDGNGAAIRYEGGNLSLTDDYFHNNQEGLLGNSDDPSGTISVEHSEFAFNGNGSGFTHNFYSGNIASVTINNSYFHDAIIGHEIKSRAQSTSVTNSRIFDNNTDSSYSIDTPNGGNVSISGNTIEQGPNSENNAIFAWGEEGNTNGGAETISNNTIVNDRSGGYGVLGGPATFASNDLWNLSNLGNAIDGGNNVDLGARPSLDTSSLSFIATDVGPSSPPTNPPDSSPPPSDGSGGGTPIPPPVEPPSPIPTLTLDQYHAMAVTDFFNYAANNPSVWNDTSAIHAIITEITSTTVLTSPVPGDLWS